MLVRGGFAINYTGSDLTHVGARARVCWQPTSVFQCVDLCVRRCVVLFGAPMKGSFAFGPPFGFGPPFDQTSDHKRVETLTIHRPKALELIFGTVYC